MSRQRIRWGVSLFFLAVIVASESVTRGYVYDGDGRPLVGADVVLGDSGGVFLAGQSDERGYFSLVHRPFARAQKSLLICASGNTVHVSRQATSAWIRSSYSIGAQQSVFPLTAADLGWPTSAPPSCPSKPTPPAG